MIDYIRDNLRKQYDINAEYCNIDAVVDKPQMAFSCEIYQSNNAKYYAVITGKDRLPSNEAIVTCLNEYEQQEEYDIYAQYIFLKPHSPIQGFCVFQLEPHVIDGSPQPMSELYDI